MNIYSLDKHSFIFPDARFADDKGLLAFGGDLHPSRILTAYRNGIFPWYNESDPILWWSPNPRFILKLDEFKVSKSLKKTINKQLYEIKFDTNFEEVLKECKKIKRKDNRTSLWIHDDVINAYVDLHKQGFAHSFEAYYQDELVGGGYGINIGNIFCGESMFSKKDDASKVALYFLVEKLKDKGFLYIDCQIPTPHLQSLGAKGVCREEFLKLVEQSVNDPKQY